MAVKKNKKHSSEQKSELRKILVFVGIVIAIIVIGGGIFALKVILTPKPTDSVTFCPEQIESVTAVLLDATDPPSPAQRKEAKNRIEEIKKQLPINGRIDLYALGMRDKDGLTERFFSLCNPGETLNPLVQKATADRLKQVKKLWKEGFGDKLTNQIERFLASPATNESPILEAVREVALQSFDTFETKNATRKNLIIVSDMIENTRNYSQYKLSPSKLNFADLQYLPFYKLIAVNALNDVRVEIIYIKRRDALSGTEAHYNFWRSFFESVGATVRSINPI